MDIHMVKNRLGTGVPRSPESNAPISSVYAPPHFPRNQPVLATYSGQYFLSFSFSFLLPPLPPDLNWESEEKKAEAASRAWEVSERGNDEELATMRSSSSN